MSRTLTFGVPDSVYRCCRPEHVRNRRPCRKRSSQFSRRRLLTVPRSWSSCGACALGAKMTLSGSTRIEEGGTGRRVAADVGSTLRRKLTRGRKALVKFCDREGRSTLAASRPSSGSSPSARPCPTGRGLR